MPSMGYVTIEGEQQGDIEGAGSHEDQDGLIEIFSFDHEVALPRKSAQALTAGRPVHHEVRMGKLVDNSTPKLFQALDQHERLTKVTIEWYAHNQSGISELAFSIELDNALVTSIKSSMPDFLDVDSDRYRFLEYVSLAYESIIWSHGKGDVQFEAAWPSQED